MATWSRSKRWIEVHEWHVPFGCWNQLAQAIDDAVKSYAEANGILVGDVADNDVLFKTDDENVIIYYEIERKTPKPAPQVVTADPWGKSSSGWGNDEPPF